jgi:metallo-beta-lactamase class B
MTLSILPKLPTDPFELLKQGCERPWEVAVDPFEVAERTYYVGNLWVGAYLVETREGLILIDTTMQPQVYLVFESIRKLGFDPADIRLILVSHMHYDHLGGVRPLQEASGARVLMSREDWAFMTARPDQIFDCGYPFGEFEPDGFYDDAVPVVLGDREIRTVLTPGHTPGTTSFFFDAGPHLCGLHGGVGLNTLSDAFLKETGLPVSARDEYLATMLRVRQMPVEITLGSHPGQVGMIEKVRDIRPGFNPYLDRHVWTRLIDGRIAQVRKLMEDSI